jgi:hypothetical protein
MDASSEAHTGSADWNRIFEVLQRPTKERIQMIQPGCDICVGDFGWASPKYPRDKDGFIHLTGYDEKYSTIWYADFEASEVRFVGTKPAALSAPNPFPVRRAVA